MFTVQHFTVSYIHYYCEDSEQDEVDLLCIMNDLNTVEVTEHLCGSYHDYQGMYNIHSHTH